MFLENRVMEQNKNKFLHFYILIKKKKRGNWGIFKIFGFVLLDQL